jgi:hypothetical protein
MRLLLGVSAIALIVTAAWQAPRFPTTQEADAAAASTTPPQNVWAEVVRLPEFFRSIEESQVRKEALNADRDAIDARIQARAQVVGDILAGRLVLSEGLRRFRELTEADPYFDLDGFRRSFAGTNDEERHTRRMIAFLRHHTDNLPAAARDLADQLEADLQRRRQPSASCEGNLCP